MFEQHLSCACVCVEVCVEMFSQEKVTSDRYRFVNIDHFLSHDGSEGTSMINAKVCENKIVNSPMTFSPGTRNIQKITTLRGAERNLVPNGASVD